MNNPALSLHQLPQQQTGWSRYASVTFVVAFHIVAIWALANGLAVKLGIVSPPVFETRVIDQPQERQHKQVTPPKPTLAKIEPQIQTPEPVIQIAPDPNAQTIQTTPQPQQPVMATDASASGMTSTHTTPPYPAVARRLGQQGTVILALAIGADGTVTDAQVATSSGVPELDQAAVTWVKSHWRYKPAIQGGMAVPSTTRAAVKFDLKDTK